MRWLAAVLAVMVMLSASCKEKASSPAAATSKPAAASVSAAAAGNWPGFRGPDPCGPAPAGGDPPVQIDPARDVRFAVDVPAEGQSSPIIWGERVYLTGESATITLADAGWTVQPVVEIRQRIMAFDRATGKLLWDTALDAPEEAAGPGDGQVEEKLQYTGLAAPTAVTDGQRVYAFFGTSVLGCVDTAGKQVWAQRLIPGKPRNTYGLAASPVLCGELLIQEVDLGDSPEKNLSFIVAVRASDGIEVWRRDRPVQSGWATPLLARLPLPDGQTLITAARPWVIAYDPQTGAERWRAGGNQKLSEEGSGKAAEAEAVEVYGDVAASPIVCGQMVLAPSGENGKLLAIRPGGHGDVTRARIAWQSDSAIPMPSVASPVSDGRRYFHIGGSSGDLYCLDPASGEQLWKCELTGQFWSSPVLAAGRIYAINSEGVLFVVSTDGKKLAENKLDEEVTTSPAIVDGRIYIRSTRRLLCIGRP